MTNLYKRFYPSKEELNLQSPSRANLGKSSFASSTLSKANDESIQKISWNGLLDDDLQFEDSCSTNTIAEMMKETSFPKSDSLTQFSEDVSSWNVKEIASEEVSGMDLMKKFATAPDYRNFADSSSNYPEVGSCSDEDDGSIASRVLSLSSSCKSSMFGSGGRSSESTYEKCPKIRSVKFEYCTEGLGSESSDVSVSSFRRSEEERESVSQDEKATIVDFEDNSNLPTSANAGGKENCMPKTNFGCATERVKTTKCASKFPPPLSTLTRTGYPHLPNTPLVFLRPLRMDGRFVLREVRVPCRDFLRASRKDGRLRLELVRHGDKATFGCSSWDTWQENNKRGSECLLGEEEANLEDEAEESSMKEKRGVRSAVENSKLKVEAKSKEERQKEDGVPSPKAESSNSEEINGIVQEACSPKLERSNSEKMKGMVREDTLFDDSNDLTRDLERKNEVGLKSFLWVDGDQNLSKVSGSLYADQVDRSMPKTHQDDYCSSHFNTGAVGLGFISTRLQQPLEQKQMLGSPLMPVEDHGTADSTVLSPHFDVVQLGLVKHQLQQQLPREEVKEKQVVPPDYQEVSIKQHLVKRSEECHLELPTTITTTSSLSKLFDSISLESGNGKWHGQIKEQEEIVNFPTVKVGADDTWTNLSGSHSMPTLSSSFPDLQLSLTRMQAAIISNAEALHISCKKGLDGNDWKKAVSPLVGVPLRC